MHVCMYALEQGLVEAADSDALQGLCTHDAYRGQLTAMHCRPHSGLSTSDALQGLFDNVLADYLWARAVMLTSPTVS